MLTPMKNLGSQLMVVFAWGGLWAVGYLITPMFEADLPEQKIQFARFVMMLLALIGIVVFAITRGKETKWAFNQDVVLQLCSVSILICLINIWAYNNNMPVFNILYATLSLVGVAKVAHLAIK